MSAKEVVRQIHVIYLWVY